MPAPRKGLRFPNALDAFWSMSRTIAWQFGHHNRHGCGMETLRHQPLGSLVSLLPLDHALAARLLQCHRAFQGFPVGSSLRSLDLGQCVQSGSYTKHQTFERSPLRRRDQEHHRRKARAYYRPGCVRCVPCRPVRRVRGVHRPTVSDAASDG